MQPGNTKTARQVMGTHLENSHRRRLDLFRWLSGSGEGRKVEGTGGRSFTLVELLVVIAIISLLAALLLPALNAARESAKRAACVNNLHQWGISLAMYEGDNGRYPPPAVELPATLLTTNDPNPHILAWQGPNGDMRKYLNPYVKDWRISRCPRIRRSWDPNGIPYPLPAGDWITMNYTYFFGNFGNVANLLRSMDYWLDTNGGQRTALMSDLFWSHGTSFLVNHNGGGYIQQDNGGPTFWYAQEYQVTPVPGYANAAMYSSTLFTDGSVLGRSGDKLEPVMMQSPDLMDAFYLPKDRK